MDNTIELLMSNGKTIEWKYSDDGYTLVNKVYPDGTPYEVFIHESKLNETKT